ncbi:hypothetical protein DH2020_006713 [Rehmannia glutinosa]|uniref:Uncharacterized protein n=1 Tax=Rehmannia glutinosa TaxID=99300 RepID=A0ABR0XJZ2_REHGL
MIQIVPLNCSMSSFLVEPNRFTQCSKSTASRSVSCSVSRSNIPKLEPFSRNKIDRAVKEPPLIQKSENQIAGKCFSFVFLLLHCSGLKVDYCLTLEGDDSYSCWQAYFELKDFEELVFNHFNPFPFGNLTQKESPKEEVERLIIEAGGVKSLINCVHGVASIHKTKKERSGSQNRTNVENAGSKPCPIPDGLPKTAEELEEEEKARMPDSPFTRLLRARGRYPAWYSPAPEHETD